MAAPSPSYSSDDKPREAFDICGQGDGTPSRSFPRQHFPGAAVNGVIMRPTTPSAWPQADLRHVRSPANRSAIDSICSITSLMAAGCWSGG